MQNVTLVFPPGWLRMSVDRQKFLCSHAPVFLSLKFPDSAKTAHCFKLKESFVQWPLATLTENTDEIQL